jgi:hypothetical protein
VVFSLFPPPLPRSPRTGAVRAGWTPFPKPRLKLGRGLVVSIVVHLVLLFLLLYHFPCSAPSPQVARENPIQIPLYLPPPARPVETHYRRDDHPPPLPPATPITEGPDKTPGRAQVTPNPESNPNAQPDATPATGSQVLAGKPAPAPAPTTPAPATPNAAGTTPAPNPASDARTDPATAAPAIVSEAQRIFGRPTVSLNGPAGERDARPWQTSDPSASRGCTIPDSEQERDSTVPAGMAAISGRIYREDTHQPLAGARLQILGTPYGAFSDGQGYYRLIFERSLVNRCRSQVVRVSAAGYQGRDVTLFIGPGGTDVPLRRF